MDARWDSLLQFLGPLLGDFLAGFLFFMLFFLNPWDRWAQKLRFASAAPRGGRSDRGGLNKKKPFVAPKRPLLLKSSSKRLSELIRLGEFLKMALSAGEPPEKGLQEFLDFYEGGLQIRPAVRSLNQFLEQGLMRKEGPPGQLLKEADENLGGLCSTIVEHSESGASLLPSLEAWIHQKRSQQNEIDELRRHTAQPITQIFVSAWMPFAIAIGSYALQPDLFKRGLGTSIGKWAALSIFLFIGFGLFWAVRCLQKALKSGDLFRFCSQLCFRLKRMAQAGVQDDEKESALLSELIVLRKTAELNEWSRYLTHVIEKSKDLGVSRSTMLQHLAVDFEKKAHREVMKAVSLCSTKILLPLFFCFLPAVLLALWIPMIPLLSELF